MTQSLYSGSNWIYYSLPSLVSDTTGCDFGYSFISDPVFDCHLPAFLLPSRYTISVTLRPFLIRAKDFLRVAKCYQDFVAPAPCHISLSVAGLFTYFVAPALRENAFWCCLLDRSRERYSRHSEAEWDDEEIFEGGRRLTKGRSGTKGEMIRQNIQESEWIMRTERSIIPIRKERMIIPCNASILRRRLPFCEGIRQSWTTNQQRPESTFECRGKARKERDCVRISFATALFSCSYVSHELKD